MTLDSYVGAKKLAFEIGYGICLMLYDADATMWFPNRFVMSTGRTYRRGSASVIISFRASGVTGVGHAAAQNLQASVFVAAVQNAAIANNLTMEALPTATQLTVLAPVIPGGTPPIVSATFDAEEAKEENNKVLLAIMIGGGITLAACWYRVLVYLWKQDQDSHFEMAMVDRKPSKTFAEILDEETMKTWKADHAQPSSSGLAAHASQLGGDNGSGKTVGHAKYQP